MVTTYVSYILFVKNTKAINELSFMAFVFFIVCTKVLFSLWH